MLLGFVIAWLVVNALIVAFLTLRPLRHLSSLTRRGSQPPAEPSESPSQRSLV